MDVDFFLSKFMLLVSCDTHSECEIIFFKKKWHETYSGTLWKTSKFNQPISLRFQIAWLIVS
jgi:hypothetical protein